MAKATCRFVLDDDGRCPGTALGGGDFCAVHGDRLRFDMELLREVHAHHMLDVSLFWTRSNFFLAVDAGLLSVYALRDTSLSDVRLFHYTAGVLGLTLTLWWFLVARGSILWIQRWRKQLSKIDRIVDRHRLFASTEAFAGMHPLSSPSFVTQFLPVAFGIVWVVLLVGPVS